MKLTHLFFALSLALVACSKKPQSTAVNGEEAQKAAEMAADLRTMEQQEERLRREIEIERLAMEREELRIQRDALAEKGRRLTDDELALEKEKTALAQEQAAAAARQAQASATPQTQPLQPSRPMPTQGTSRAPVSSIPVSAMGDYDYSIFYDRLSNEGTWFQSADYGYVWRPSIVLNNQNWRPYTYGNWAYTNYGWTWVSTETFGWATYHYGRWVLLRNSGWCWVPGNEWAPAWVCWKSGGDYVGWAPLPPESLYWRGNDWNNYYGNAAGISPRCFSFVRVGSFGGAVISAVFSTSDCVRIYQQTNYCGGYRWENRRVHCDGVAYDWVNRHVSRPLPRYDCDFDNRPPTHLDPLRYAATRGDRLRVNAPNFNVPWNGALRPRTLESKPLQDEVIREAAFEPKQRERFVSERRNERERAEESMRGGLAQKMTERIGLQERISRQREELATTLEAVKPEPNKEPSGQQREGERRPGKRDETPTAPEMAERPADRVRPGNRPSERPVPTPDRMREPDTAQAVEEKPTPEVAPPVATVPNAGDQRPSGLRDRQPNIPRETRDGEADTSAMRRQQEQAALAERQAQAASEQRQGAEQEAMRERPVDRSQRQREELAERASVDAAKDAEKAAKQQQEMEQKTLEAQQRAQESQLREQQAQQAGMREQQQRNAEREAKAQQQAMREAEEQQEKQAREQMKAARDAQEQQEAMREAQEKSQKEEMRAQQEAARAAQEQAQQQQMREQQEAAREAQQQRAQQEAMREAQERAQQEQMREQQEAAREAQQQRAQQEAMREAQERAQQEQMREQQEAAREAQQRAQQEQMQRQQEAAREAQNQARQEQMQRQQEASREAQQQQRAQQEQMERQQESMRQQQRQQESQQQQQQQQQGGGLRERRSR